MEKNLMTRPSNTEGLALCPFVVNEAYLNTWNERSRDFVVLARDGEPLRETLYRVGGIGTAKIKGLDYFLLLKHTEAHWPEKIMRDARSGGTSNHLQAQWCILDKFGNERLVFDQFQHPWLVKNSCLYSLGKRYGNIETGEVYATNAYTAMESAEYLFLDNSFGDDPAKKGVLKIHKQTGAYELYPA